MKTLPVVMITGASRGIGAATALAFGQAGWRVAITARTISEGQMLDHQLRRPDGKPLSGSLGKTADALRVMGVAVHAQTMDLMDKDSLDLVVAGVLAEFGRVDVLINNAVYQDREMNSLLLDLTDDMLERTLLGNVVAPLHLTRRLLPSMIAQGGGLVINVCSGAGLHDPPVPANQGGWGFAYGASKAALIRLAGCINRECGHQGVRSYSVNPGVVSTEAVMATLGDDSHLAQRYGAVPPEAIARAILWLTNSENASEVPKHKGGMVELQELIKTFGWMSSSTCETGQ